MDMIVTQNHQARKQKRSYASICINAFICDSPSTSGESQVTIMVPVYIYVMRYNREVDLILHDFIFSGWR